MKETELSPAELRPDVRPRLREPVILWSRGGSGSRLLSFLAGCLGLQAPGSHAPRPGDLEAFENARFVHLVRDPLTTCLRRTHMTARFDNGIGRVAIRAAYHYCGRDLERSLFDSPELRMAYTTIHQVEAVREFARLHLRDRYLEVRFEDILNRPATTLGEVSRWLGVEPARGRRLETEADPARAARPLTDGRYPPDTIEELAQVLAPLRRALGYLQPEPPSGVDARVPEGHNYSAPLI